MILEQIVKDITVALKNKEKKRLTVLRSLKSAFKYREIELRKELSEDECISILSRQVKSREQSIELYLKGDRQDLADLEKFEIEVIRTYLPIPLTETELKAAVEEAITRLNISGMKDMGFVMKDLKASLGSRADGKILSSIVRQKLA